MTDKKDPNKPIDLSGAFAMEVAWVQAHLVGFFKGLKGVGRAFSSAASPGNYGINKDLMIIMVADAIQGARIEPYQASLLLATNLSEPISEDGKTYRKWNDFLGRLIEIHNDKEKFNFKRYTLLRILMSNGLGNFDNLKQVGLARNHFHESDPNYEDTLEDVMHPHEDNIPYDRKPAKVTQKSVEEIQDNVPVKTYAAIPKARLMPLMAEAMQTKRMSYVQAAVMLAVNCHAMERRRTGERYLDHIMAVAADPELNARQRVVAIMHDVIENSNYTLADLESMGFPKSLLKSLEHVTKRKDEKVYLHFIQRVSLDDDALAVKMADIHHNSSDALTEKDPAKLEKYLKKREKYAVALEYLEAVKMGEITAGSSIEKFARDRGIYQASHFVAEVKESSVQPPPALPPAAATASPA